MNEKLPTGWSLNQIKNFIGPDSLFCDGDWVESKDQDDKGTNRLIQLADIGDGKFLNKSNRFLNDTQFRYLRCTALEDGDILIARMPDPLGRACLFTDMDQRCATVVDVAIIRRPLSDPSWLVHVINSDQVRTQIEGSASGTTRTRISRGSLAVLWVITPPRAVQQKVARILQTIDKAIEHTGALIEKYQQIKAGLMQDLFTRGIGVDGKLRPPREQAPEIYQQTPIGWIPKEWAVRKLGSMASIVSGVTLGSKNNSGRQIDAPYLRVANVQDGYLDLNEIKTVKVSAKTLGHLRLETGDVLMNEGGDFDKLGRGAVWENQVDNCIHQNHVFRVRCVKDLLMPRYLAYFSESAFGKTYFLLSAKQSTNLASINSKQLHAYPIALPSIEEQQEVVARVFAANSFICSLNTELCKYQTQKSGLMHDLLTGKVIVTPNTATKEAADVQN